MTPTGQTHAFIHAEIAYHTKMLTISGAIFGVLLTGMIGLLAADPATFSYPFIAIDGIALFLVFGICFYFHGKLRHFINELRNPE